MKVSNNPESHEYKIQDKQYLFPYHYIPYIENNIGKIYRKYHNGYEYLCYTQHVVEKITNLNPSSVLEIGCGDGQIIGKLDTTRKLGVDLSSKAIEFAKIFNPEVEFKTIDASEISEEFDVVFAVEVLEHIPDSHIKKFIETIENRVKKNGHVIISVPTIVKPLIEKHYRHYDLNLFKSQLEDSNTKLEIKEVEYIYSENRLMRLYKRWTNNKYWFLQSSYLEKKVWKYIWTKLRFGKPQTGTHLVVTLQKKK